MNGQTRIRLQAGIIGAVVTLILTLTGFAFGYGQLNSRVNAMENRMNHVEDIRERLVRVETLVERIDRKVGS